ncbi:hypothetical protein B0H13DRAFT_2278384 [Mycena leptocephala]|nr:hypothetical protein B0H13DRAFT_2278384 [Mycena leptocephala]
MVISVDKTKWMLFGPFPRITPSLYVNSNIVALVDKYKFVGIWFTSVKRNLFEKHYLVKASKAQGVAHASFTVDSMIGSLPPREGVQLYMARVDPHLISGCEVVLDVTSRLVTKLEKPQLRFLRRLLGLKPRSMRAILFTETGLLPIRYGVPSSCSIMRSTGCIYRTITTPVLLTESLCDSQLRDVYRGRPICALSWLPSPSRLFVQHRL